MIICAFALALTKDEFALEFGDFLKENSTTFAPDFEEKYK